MNARVVVADEQGILREGLVALLSREPELSVVGVAHDGLECVRMVRQYRPDVVVMDVSMSGLNGIEAARRIASDMPETRILFLTSQQASTVVKGAFEAGGSGYLLKLCGFSELLRALRAVLMGQIYLSPSVAHVIVGEYRASPSTRAEARVPSSVLTRREREIMQLLSEGHSTKAIAQRLHVSQKTVGTHREHIMLKLNIGSIAELTRYAIREGITSLEVC